MTDNEIIKAMQCVIGNDVKCSECTYQKVLPFPSCRRKCAKNALDLINRQKAEIERLQKKANTPFAKITFDRDKLQEIVDEYVKNIEIDISLVKSEAIKECLAKVKNYIKTHCNPYGKPDFDYDTSLRILHFIDRLAKEMTEVETNQRKEDEGK